MARPPDPEILTVRLPAPTRAWLARTAKRRQLSKSELVRELIESQRLRSEFDLEAEARRQSLLVARRASERDALAFVEAAADSEGWR